MKGDAKTFLRGLAFAAIAIASAGACGGNAVSGGEPASGVLVIAIDGLRAGHVGSFGHHRKTTPTLDALAGEGLVFRNTFATAPLPLPSHISILTGTEPEVSERFVAVDIGPQRWRVPDEVPNLAVEFLAAGYRTAAFFDREALGRRNGMERGFQRFRVAEEGDYVYGQYTAGQVARLQDWLRSIGRDARWFAYLHLGDLERSWSQPQVKWERYFEAGGDPSHIPPVGNSDDVYFAIPLSRWRGGMRSVGEYEAAYDGHVRKLDEELAKLFAELRRTGRDANTTIVVLGTHGIQFGEAGLFLRSGGYSIADLSVPLVVRPRPDREANRGARVEAVTSLLDVAPTLLELEGIRTPETFDGFSQLPWIVGPGPERTLREHAFASCGLQSGGVVVGERFLYEVTEPSTLVSDFARRSWRGEAVAEPSSEPIIRFFDRVATPFPALTFRTAEPAPAELDEFEAAYREWSRGVQLRRRELQSGGDSP